MLYFKSLTPSPDTRDIERQLVKKINTNRVCMHERYRQRCSFNIDTKYDDYHIYILNGCVPMYYQVPHSAKHTVIFRLCGDASCRLLLEIEDAVDVRCIDNHLVFLKYDSFVHHLWELDTDYNPPKIITSIHSYNLDTCMMYSVGAPIVYRIDCAPITRSRCLAYDSFLKLVENRQVSWKMYIKACYARNPTKLCEILEAYGSATANALIARIYSRIPEYVLDAGKSTVIDFDDVFVVINNGYAYVVNSNHCIIAKMNTGTCNFGYENGRLHIMEIRLGENVEDDDDEEDKDEEYDDDEDEEYDEDDFSESLVTIWHSYIDVCPRAKLCE